MSAFVFYKDREIEITNAIVSGKSGSFSLSDVIGIESRFPLWPLVASLAIAGVQLALLNTLDSGLPRTIVFATWVFNVVAILCFCFGRSVSARMPSGAVRLSGIRTSKDRRRIANAFAEAKQRSGQTTLRAT